MATDVNADLHTEIENAIDRVRTLVTEGNREGAEELAQEAETLISALKGRSKDAVARRKEYRAGVAEALKAEPASTEVALRMPETIDDVDGLEELVNLGAKRVREITEGKVRGGREIATILLDTRRRIILPDGTPDLNARSHAAKKASSEIYDRVTANLPAEGEDPLADAIRDEINGIKRQTQNYMKDVRVEYLRALDTSDAEALKPYADILEIAEEGVKPSEAVAAHYGIKLQTMAELAAEKRAAKAELAARAESGEELDPEEAAELSGEKYVSPADALRKVPAQLDKLFSSVSTKDISEAEFDERERADLRAKLTDQLTRLSALIAAIS